MKYFVIFLVFFAIVDLAFASEPEPNYPLEFPKFISGIPILQKYTVTNEPDYYHEINASQYDWAMRVIEQGYATVNEEELREFWSFVSKEGNFNFAITLPNDTVKHAKIQFNDTLLRNDQHYIRVFPLYQETLEKYPHVIPDKYETISLVDHSWLRIPVHDPYSWKPMPDYAIVEYKRLTSGGTYYFEIIDGDNARLYNIQHIGIGLESNTHDIQSPLKQFKSGITFDKIQCKEDLVLIQKYDGSPACVMESTKTKLIERGWTGLTSTIKESLLKRSSNLPEVIAFYETYPDAEASIKNDHVSYFAGNDKGYFVRMNLMFDKNYSIADIDFHCYYQRVHQYELPQEDIVSKIVNYDCEEHGKTVMGE